MICVIKWFSYELCVADNIVFPGDEEL